MLGVQRRGVPVDVAVVEYGTGERDRLSQFRSCQCGQVRGLIRIEPAEPDDVPATAGTGWGFLTHPELDRQRLGRCVVGVSPCHLR